MTGALREKKGGVRCCERLRRSQHLTTTFFSHDARCHFERRENGEALDEVKSLYEAVSAYVIPNGMEWNEESKRTTDAASHVSTNPVWNDTVRQLSSSN